MTIKLVSDHAFTTDKNKRDFYKERLLEFARSESRPWPINGVSLSDGNYPDTIVMTIHSLGLSDIREESIPEATEKFKAACEVFFEHASMFLGNWKIRFANFDLMLEWKAKNI